MNTRRWLALLLVLVVAAAVTLYALPGIVRRVAVGQIHAITGRPTTIDRVDLSLLRGHVVAHGVRLLERDGRTPFADVSRIELRVSLPSLLRGHVWLRELAVTDSTVRIVRLESNVLNVSDLLGKSEATEKRRDITVDHFRVVNGTVTLEDRAVPESPTWTSERMMIDARNISTRRDDGTAVATSVTAGAPVRIEISKLRLYPIHLEATATVEGLDLTPAQVYFPPDAAFRIDRGRLSTRAAITVDARDGVRADATARVADAVLVKAGTRDRLASMPLLTAQVDGFGLREGDFRLQRLVADGTMTVRDPTATGDKAFRPSTVQARVADLTWPATTPGRVDLRATIPGGGTLSVDGTVRPPPAATQLSVRLASVDLAPWAQFFPVAAAVTGVASANLRMDEPLAAGIPARLQGTVAVDRVAVADGGQQIVAARRVEASGLEVHWPTRVAVRRIVVTGPRATVERAADGTFAVVGLFRRDEAPKPAAATQPVGVTVGEVVVRDGMVAWRDATVRPAARLDVADIDATVIGAGWPLTGPLTVQAAVRPPGGGHLRVAGRVGVEPLTADVRVTTRGAELAPYQPYLPTTARISGAADVDLAVVVPPLAERRATARGTAALSRVDVRDGQRTVLRAERARATDVDVSWPERIAIGRLALARPWLLLERDDTGALGLRRLAPRSGRATSDATNGETNGQELAITVARVTVADGGLRVVDRAISPAFAVDFHDATLRMDGLSTVAAPPARLDLTARLAGAAELVLRGTLRALGGPLKVDVDGELREFAVPRANSYLVNQVGWKSREGRMTAKVRARIDGDALNAKTDIRVSRLRLVRAGEDDEAQRRIGLPLGTLTALMKNSRGDINVSVPVGGRLGDPRFDLRDTIWSAVRTVAVNAITLPVSWIGRVQFSADSKIQRIQVDPIPFEPGTADLTPDGRERVTRLTAFLEQLPEVRMALTPVVSARDVAAIQRRTAEASPARNAPSAEGAALPRSAVVERPPVPASALPDLAKGRLETVRAAFKEAGIDAARLTETAFAERNTADAHIELEVLEPEGPRPSKMRQILRRMGVPLKDDAGD